MLYPEREPWRGGDYVVGRSRSTNRDASEAFAAGARELAVSPA